jgi:hypothetical protein
MIQCELGREPGGQTSLPDNNLVLVSVNDINSFMTILIIIIFSFESNQINLDLLSNEAKIRDLLHSFSSNFGKWRLQDCVTTGVGSSIVAQRSSRCPYSLLLIELPTPVV